MGAIIALGHHEKFDGSGYPNGLHGEDIPIVARVVAVADVFDALVSVRPYKHAWTIEGGFAYLESQKGKHFDPRCVEAFMSGADRVREDTEGAGRFAGGVISTRSAPAARFAATSVATRAAARSARVSCRNRSRKKPKWLIFCSSPVGGVESLDHLRQWSDFPNRPSTRVVAASVPNGSSVELQRRQRRRADRLCRAARARSGRGISCSILAS